MFENMPKTSLEPRQKCSTEKCSPKTPNIPKITSVPKSEKFAIMQNHKFGSKIKLFKDMQITSVEPQQKCSTQKSTPKTPNIPKITSVQKFDKFAIMHGL